MLELLDTLFLCCLFGFFWANCPCCGAVCPQCPDGASRTISVIFPGLLPHPEDEDPFTITDCEYCEVFAEILHTVPFDPGSVVNGICEWIVVEDSEERWCVTGVNEPPLPPNYWFLTNTIRVQINGGVISLLVGSDVAGFTWTKAMPGHDETSGPCGPQTIVFDDPGTPFGSPNPLADACDFASIIPEVTFF